MKTITREQYKRMESIIYANFDTQYIPKLLTEGKYKSKNKVIINKDMFPLLKMLVLENKSADIISVKQGDSVYTLEKAGNKYYVRRDMPQFNETFTQRAVLTAHDLKEFSDINNPTEQELAKLGVRLEHKESKFGI